MVNSTLSRDIYRPSCRTISLLLLIIIAVLPCGARGQTGDPSPPAELENLSLEALMELQVTSAAKKSQKLANAAAAIFVITRDDIRRSGATSLAEALRMAPGVEVARIDANKWAVSIRGFNGRFADKLLVLMDGRCLYTPLFSGTYWEVQDAPLEDIDRIEVIRGPGAALWGANAVNGVINITTRSAGETPGGLISAGAGTEERGFGTVRYGVSLGAATDLRVYVKYLNRGTGVDSQGNDTHDSWYMTRGGFRLDSQMTDSDTLTVQGDYYDANLNETYVLYLPPTFYPPQITPATSGASGGNLLSRWERKFSDTSDLSLTAYYDHYERSTIIVSEKRDTIDMDFQHRFALGKSQEIIWGIGYRYSHDEVDNKYTVSFFPSRKDDNLFSAFLQDEISLIPERLALIVGSKFEHNDYSGFEVQPTGRLIWTPNPQHSVWSAISRAVRTPSQIDQDVRYRQSASIINTGYPPPYPAQIPVVAAIMGSKGYESEEMIAYELGYRTEPLPNLSFDLATFYNDYDHLRALRTGEFIPPSSLHPFGEQTFYLENGISGHSCGVELAAEWRPREWWRLQAAGTLLWITAYLDTFDANEYTQAHNLILKQNMEGSYPHQQFSLRSGFNVTRDVDLDFWFRGASRLSYIDTVTVPGYVTLDARLAWRPVSTLELALVGQNLLQEHRPEFIPEFINTIPTQIPRGVYGKVTWRF